MDEALTRRKLSTRLGLAGMRERLLLVGGQLKIESSDSTGTTIFARIPFLARGSRMSEKTRVALADDHPIVLAGLRNLIETEADLELVGEGNSGSPRSS